MILTKKSEFYLVVFFLTRKVSQLDERLDLIKDRESKIRQIEVILFQIFFKIKKFGQKFSL